MNRRFGLRRFYRVPLFLLVQVLAIAVVTSAGILTDHKGVNPTIAVHAVNHVVHGSTTHRPAFRPSPSSTLAPGQVASADTFGAVNTSTTGVTDHATAGARAKAPTRTTGPKHGTTTTTSSAPAAPSGHALALGVAVFQPTTQFQNYQSAVGTLPSFLEWYQSWPAIGAVSSSAPLYWGSQEQVVQTD
jgi:hypothetical protein